MSTDAMHPGATGSAAPEGDARLSGDINVFQLVFTVMAYNAPMFVFIAFLPVAILLGNGVGSPVTFLVCGAIVAMLAKGFVTMGLTMQKPGGFYSFISEGLGKMIGLGSGFAAMVCYFVGGLGGYLLGGIGFSAVVKDIFGGPQLDWWVGALLMLALVTALGYFNIGLSARVLTVFLAAELVFMLIYVVAVVAQGGADGLGLDSFHPDAIFSGSIGIALMFGIGIFGGFEATVIFRDEVREPRLTIPRATYTVVALLAGAYALVAWAFINSYGAEAVMAVLETDAINAANNSIKEFQGTLAYEIAVVLLLSSSFALSLAAHNIAARYAFNLSADRILPASLSQPHPRFDSPHRSSMLMSFITAAILLYMMVTSLAPETAYAPVAGLYSYTLVLLLLLVSAAVVAYLVRHRPAGTSTLTIAMTAFSMIVFAVVLVLATLNFDLLGGTTGWGTVAILGLVYGIMLGGVLWAARLRSAQPDIYERIGRDDASLSANTH